MQAECLDNHELVEGRCEEIRDPNSPVLSPGYCTAGCKVFNDGCNTCRCNDRGQAGCTKKVCSRARKGMSYCMQWRGELSEIK